MSNYKLPALPKGNWETIKPPKGKGGGNFGQSGSPLEQARWAPRGTLKDKISLMFAYSIRKLIPDDCDQVFLKIDWESRPALVAITAVPKDYDGPTDEVYKLRKVGGTKTMRRVYRQIMFSGDTNPFDLTTIKRRSTMQLHDPINFPGWIIVQIPPDFKRKVEIQNVVPMAS